MIGMFNYVRQNYVMEKWKHNETTDTVADICMKDNILIFVKGNISWSEKFIKISKDDGQKAFETSLKKNTIFKRNWEEENGKKGQLFYLLNSI